MNLAQGDKVKITGTATTYDGRAAEVVHALASGRYLVAVDGYLSASGLRMYPAANLVGLTPAAPPAPPPSQYRYNDLVFEDTFDGPAIDLAKFNIWPRTGTASGHAGRGLRDAAACKVRANVEGATGNGNAAVITAWWDPVARMLHQGIFQTKVAFLHGRWEARVRMTADPTNSTGVNAPLLWPLNEGSDPASTRGEVDFYESTGPENAMRGMRAYLHYGATNQQRSYNLGVSGLEWHVVTLDWDEAGMRGYVDGVLKWSNANLAEMPPAPMIASFQIDAVANQDCGAPRELFIDWCRIYQ